MNERISLEAGFVTGGKIASPSPAAVALASQCPLVHVTAKPNLSIPLLFSPPFALKPSGPNSSKRTLEVEGRDGLDIGPCLYFYAGRAEPFGDLALVFAPGIEANHSGTVTPFDSGGFWLGRIRHRLSAKGPGALREMFDFCSVPLARWRDMFACFLSRHFAQPADYLDREKWPIRDGRAFGLYAPAFDNGIRAWTVEVRFGQEHVLLDAVVWCARESVASEVTWKCINDLTSYDPEVRTRLADFAKRDLFPGGTPDYLERVEDAVRERLNP